MESDVNDIREKRRNAWKEFLAEPYEPKGFIAELTSDPRAALYEESGTVGRGVAPLVIRCQANGKEVFASIDTSSIVSTISRPLVDRLGLSKDVLAETATPHNPLLDSKGEGSRRQIEGKLRYLEVSVGEITIVTQPFVVRESATDMMFGMDFMKKCQASISLHDNSLTLLKSGTMVKKMFLNSKEVLQAVKLAVRPSSFNV